MQIKHLQQVPLPWAAMRGGAGHFSPAVVWHMINVYKAHMSFPRFLWQVPVLARGGRLLALCLAALALAGCSLLTLAYNRLPTVVFWRLDGLVDLSSEQSAWLRPRIDVLHAWQRQQQLPELAQALRQWQAQMGGELAPATVCQQVTQARGWLEGLWAQAQPDLTRLARELSPAQRDHLARHYAKADETFRSDWMGPDAAQRRLQRFADRAGMFYGDLSPAQRSWLADRLARNPFDAERSLAERQRRQADILAILRAVAQGVPADAALQALADRVRTSPDPAYRAYAQALTTDTCALVSELHARTTPEQRTRAAQRLAGYAADLEALAAQR